MCCNRVTETVAESSLILDKVMICVFTKMDHFDQALIKIRSNNEETFTETIRLLVKIADNIIKDPKNVKIRLLQKNNFTISKKILNVTGGLDCLKLMGFQENDSTLILPPTASIERLVFFRDKISDVRDEPQPQDVPKVATLSRGNKTSGSSSDVSTCSSDSSEKESTSTGTIPKVVTRVDSAKTTRASTTSKIRIPQDVPKVNLPPVTYMFNNPFIREIELAFHMALSYGDKALHKRALAVIPKADLELAAQNRLSYIQGELKKGNIEDPNISMQDLVLLELLSWFKHDFFKWVDNPECEFCNGNTTFSHMNIDPTVLIHTSRVEMHKCSSCQLLTPFPRYNDVNILLITRRGRCGEWANTFTLICCAMGWDARLVVDQGDHVWTEVFSIAQKRWIHCDPCENACDTPLIYENGWGKQLSYVIAYSSEEVQDVTWRYSCRHKIVLSRRNKCTEEELIDALIKLRLERQKLLTIERRNYLTKRILNELIELMTEKKSKESDTQGRTSGAEKWRLARGEIQVASSHCWSLEKCDTEMGNVTIRYCTALDQYEYVGVGGTKSKFGWQTGVYNVNDVFRKEEKDWKMVYLSRREGTDMGIINWKFEVENSKQVIDVVEVTLHHKTYENGKVKIDVKCKNDVINMPESTEHFRTSLLSGSRYVIITAYLFGGKGDVAWQHAQLFRQSTSSKEYLFQVVFRFKSAQ